MTAKIATVSASNNRLKIVTTCDFKSIMYFALLSLLLIISFRTAVKQCLLSYGKGGHGELAILVGQQYERGVHAEYAALELV